MSTTIYLDVDGVLNAVSTRTPYANARSCGWEEWATVRVKGFPIQYSPQMVAALNEIAAREDVTFKWLTTWKSDAGKMIAPAIGLDGQDWEVLDGDLHSWGGRDWWKFEAIRKDVEATRPEQFVWIDDDLTSERHALEWLASRTDGIAISPSVYEGLKRSGVKEILGFIDATEAAA